MNYRKYHFMILILASLLFFGCDDDDDSSASYEGGAGGMAGTDDAGLGGSSGSNDSGQGGTAGTDGAGQGGTNEGGTGGSDEPSGPVDIIETALSAGNFETLAAALTAADLVATLKSDGPFTVFAPTDKAFAALGSTVDDLLLPENKDKLIKILTYHVIAGDSAIYSTDLEDGALVSTVAGPAIAVDLSGSAPMINDAEVVTADVKATNGVIHVINKVLLPPEDIVSIASGNDDFENLVAAVKAAELVDTLQGEGPFTVFAPNDAAFDALGDTLNDLLLPENKDTLAGILTYHVISGLLGPLDLADGALVETVNGSPINISIKGDKVMVNDAEIIATNVVADNGVIHILDSVILPPEDIVSIASGNDDFENLVTAVKAAELVDTLQGEGPFTVFAPNDAAFDALGDTLNDLLLPENKDTLAGILTYHVISGLLGPLDLADGALVETVNGLPVSISLSDGIAKINDAQIIGTNVVASNGVIHILDSVILPPSDDIVNTAINTDGEFTKLEAALVAADLVSALQGEGPFTVFAPTDAAFDALGDTLDDLLLPANKDQLANILLYHVVSGAVGAADLSDGASVETLLEGKSVTFDLSSETPKVDDANIIMTNILATNGIIHVIDKVIIPE